MSTKMLRVLVEMTGCSGNASCLHCAGVAEVEAIEKAAKVLGYVDTGEVPRTTQAKNEAHDLLARIARETT